MSGGKLTPLQQRILQVLSGLEPSWTLTGGGALVGVHLKHRLTKDLDLFWHRQEQLGTLPEEVRARLAAAGLVASPLRSSTTFAQLRVSDGTEVCVVDLVAEPLDALQPPVKILLGEVAISVDTPHEILVNKLCALLSRSELRDLQDVQSLLAAGADLDRALADAPRKDAGFSPLTLAWVLKELGPRGLAKAAGFSEEDATRLETFKGELIQALLDAAAPE